jgi:hypothetical protein
VAPQFEAHAMLGKRFVNATRSWRTPTQLPARHAAMPMKINPANDTSR